MRVVSCVCDDVHCVLMTCLCVCVVHVYVVYVCVVYVWCRQRRVSHRWQPTT